MFDRMQKPFLTVETGEAYQPVRLIYHLEDQESLSQTLEKLGCIQKNISPHSWTWYWQDECNDLHFESLSSFRKDPARPLRLGTISLHDGKLSLNLPSFKRACLAVPFFFRSLGEQVATVHHADFINKVFAIDERLPHGFTELFKDEELDAILHQRLDDYHKVKQKVEDAPTAEAAFSLLSEYSRQENQKRLPYAERYVFDIRAGDDPDVFFLAFYIFLRGRELVAIKRWYGQTGYSLADVADETVEEVFGGLGVDLLD